MIFLLCTIAVCLFVIVCTNIDKKTLKTLFYFFAASSFYRYMFCFCLFLCFLVTAMPWHLLHYRFFSITSIVSIDHFEN